MAPLKVLMVEDSPAEMAQSAVHLDAIWALSAHAADAIRPKVAIPVRNVPVIAPEMKLEDEEIDPDQIASSIKAVLRRLDLGDGERPVAVFAPWRGSATFARLDAFCRGVIAGLETVLAHGHPIVLVGDGDVINFRHAT